MLSGGPGQVFGIDTWDYDSHFLLDGIMHGFKLVDPQAVIAPYSTKNYVPVKAMEYIDTLICDELRSNSSVFDISQYLSRLCHDFSILIG